MSRSGMQRPTTGLPVAVPDWVFGLSTQGIPLNVPLSINICTWHTTNGPWSATGFFPNVLRNALDQLIIDRHPSSPVAPALDYFLTRTTKGANKVELLEDALTDTPLMLPMEYCNLESMHCPTIA